MGKNLYVNTTNRCDMNCEFCLRASGDGVGSADSLWLEREPTREEILADILAQDASAYDQLVFCGYGEPTYRLDDILWVCRELKQRKYPLPIRMDTNGHSDLINGKPTVPLMAGLIDILSISLNNGTAQAYVDRVPPRLWSTVLSGHAGLHPPGRQGHPHRYGDGGGQHARRGDRAVPQDLRGAGCHLPVRHYSTNW